MTLPSLVKEGWRDSAGVVRTYCSPGHAFRANGLKSVLRS
jgi:hypothetical protein